MLSNLKDLNVLCFILETHRIFEKWQPEIKTPWKQQSLGVI